MKTGLRSKAQRACEEILGTDVYEALVSCHTALPRIMCMAAETAFQRNYCGLNWEPYVSDLRRAMNVLETGSLTDDQE